MSNKILIADDSKLVLSLVRSILEGFSSGLTVLVAHNGLEAIDLAQKENPDLILMDWQMPEMSGIEALIQLKKDTATKDIAVIMLTASESTSEAFEAGAIDFVQKPFNKNELLARVKSILDSVNAKKELKQKLIENEIQRDKLRLQKDILVKQKKELYTQQGLATKVYQLLFSTQNMLAKLSQENFLLSMPYSEIPSNMIWIGNSGANVNFCIAFMAESETPTVLISAALLHNLNQLNAEMQNDDINPAAFVKKLNDGLHHLDKQSTDILFCSYNYQKKTLQYAGANIPLYVMKKGKLVALNIEKIPVGGSREIIVNHKVQLATEDIIYVFHDGFSEAHTSEDKYLSDEFMNEVNNVYCYDLGKQYMMLQKSFENWKKELKQLSDLFIFGLKV